MERKLIKAIASLSLSVAGVLRMIFNAQKLYNKKILQNNSKDNNKIIQVNRQAVLKTKKSAKYCNYIMYANEK